MPPLTTAQKPHTVIFREVCTGELLLQAKQLCHDVYLGAGYISAAYPDRIIPNLHPAASTYIAAVNNDGNVLGTIRISEHLPCHTFDIWAGRLYPQHSKLIQKTRQEACFEIGALAVNKSCANLKISRGLYDMAYRWALAAGKKYGIISMDQRAFRALEMVGWYAIQVGAPMQYFGSVTVPAIIPINEQPTFAITPAQPFFHYLAA